MTAPAATRALPDEAPDWRTHARCDDRHILATPESTGPAGRVGAAKAKCQACPVLAQCREWITQWEAGKLLGSREAAVWAGMTPTERNDADQAPKGRSLPTPSDVTKRGRPPLTPEVFDAVQNANPGATLTAIAGILGYSPSTLTKARSRWAAEAHGARS